MRTEKLASVGSLLAAIAASSCCIGPLVALVLGVGGAAATSRLQTWRPVFLAVTFVLLAVAWYLTYRQPNAEACGEAATCAARRSGKSGKFVLWAGTVLAIALAAVPLYAGVVARFLHAEEARPAEAAGGTGATLKVRIPSMDCAACAVNIQRALRKEEGVARAEVIFKTKEAVIEYDPARISPDRIVKVINETGFKAEPLAKKEKQ